MASPRIEEEIEEEQLQELRRGWIQDTGAAVVVCARDLHVMQVSENLEKFFGTRPDAAIEKPLDVLLHHDSVEELQRALTRDARDLAELLPITVQRADGGGGLACIPSQPEEEYWVLEFEPIVLTTERSPLLPDAMRAIPCVNPAAIRRAVEELQDIEDSEDSLYQNVCATISRLIDFDRVLCYRFARDWHGEVVGETLRDPSAAPFMGLNFPATDVPQFFRNAFFKNRVRHVANIAGAMHAIKPTNNAHTGTPVDLMAVGLRATTACCRQYYSNMASRSQLMFAVTVRRKLWGTISCHHSSPTFVTYASRMALLPIIAAFGKTMERIQLEKQRATEARIRALTTAMYARAANDPESFLQALVVAPEGPPSLETPKRRRSLPFVEAAEGGPSEMCPDGPARIRSPSSSSCLLATPRKASLSSRPRTPHLDGEMPRPARRRPPGAEPEAAPSIQQIVRCSGVCVVLGGEPVYGGVCPPPGDIETLCGILDNPASLALIASEHRGEDDWAWDGEGEEGEFCLWAAESARRAVASVSPSSALEWSGGFLILLLEDGYAMWFREARTSLVRWAGCEHGDFQVKDGSYGPRLSFEQWKQEVGDECEPWSPEDEVAARVFRSAIADALRLIGTLRRLREIERRTTAARPDADFSTPADRVVAALSLMAGKPGVSAEEKRALEACLAILTSQQNMHTPNFSEQVQTGRLRLDRDTRRWLFSEIAPQTSHRTLDAMSMMSSRSLSRNNSFSGSHPSSDAEDSPRQSNTLTPRSPSLNQAGRPRSPVVSGIVIESAEAEVRRESLFHLLDHESLELACVQATLSSWDDANVFKMASGVAQGRPLCVTAWLLLEQHGLVQSFALDAHRLQAWLWCIEAGYRNNPYHSSTHAADVAQSVHWLLTRGGLAPHITPLEKLALILAAVIHDFEHPGLNNGFQIATATELALLYNDRAPLENHHVSAAWRRLRMPQHNFLSAMPAAQVRDLRKLVVDVVLSTDMAHHWEALGVFKKRAAVGFAAEGAAGGPAAPPTMRGEQRSASVCSHRSSISGEVPLHGSPPSSAAARTRLPPSDKLSTEDRRILVCTALKVADVGHSAKPLPLHVDWSNRVGEEFFAQGDRERELGLPISPFMCRRTTAVPRSQTGFFEFVAFPLFQAWASVFPAAEETLLPHLQRNYQARPAARAAPAPR